MPDQTLAQRLRAKYPGDYDDLSDSDLESRVLAKYPGVYDDLPRTAAPTSPTPAPPSTVPTSDMSIGGDRDSGLTLSDLVAGRRAPAFPPPASDSWLQRNVNAARQRSGLDFLLGAGKELVAQGQRGAEFLRNVPVVGSGVSALDALGSMDLDTRPTNTQQKIGGGLFQVAEAIAPSRAVTGLGLKAAEAAAPMLSRVLPMAAAKVLPRAAVEAAAGGSLAAIQGGDPTTGAALSAAMPVVGTAASSVAQTLKRGAQTQVEKALGATAQNFKAKASKIAPTILQKGLSGSREALQQQARAMVKTVGGQIDEALEQYGGRQATTKPILDALEESKAPFKTTRTLSAQDLAQNPRLASTAREVSPGAFETDVVIEARPIKQIEKLQQIVTDLGDNATVKQLRAVRQAWDTVVAQAGGYSHRAPGGIGLPLKEQSEAWAKREGANAIRKLLDKEVPELSVINKEFSFWKNLDEVVTQTLQRTAPQRANLLQRLAGAGGRAAGAVVGASHGPLTAAAGSIAGDQLSQAAERAFTSPRWRLMDARTRDRLASAIMAGDRDEMTRIFGRVISNRAAAAAGQ